MPLIKVEYKKDNFNDELLKSFGDSLISSCIEIFDMDKSKMSLFLYPYNKFAYSEAIAEVEIHVNRKLFTAGRSKAVAEGVKNWKSDQAIEDGIIIALTPHDWDVNWI